MKYPDNFITPTGMCNPEKFGNIRALVAIFNQMKQRIFYFINTWVFVLLLMVINLSCSRQTPQSEQLIYPPVNLDEIVGMSPVYSIEIPDTLDFAGEPVPLDIFYIRENLDRELTVNTYFHSSTLMMLKRANRWFPVIEPILKKNNLPDDFKYLALIESGFENVTSPAGAVGFWQFMKGTAKEYNLEVNDAVDERFNVEKSTEAACRYLIEAYAEYKNWTLAAASYNTGNNRIDKELARQRVSSYYDLYLSNETTRYIFRALAVKLIFLNPSKYGFQVSKEDLYPQIPTKIITVNQTVSDLVDFAHKHKITYKTLKYFNPWLRDDKLPNRWGKIYQIKIPEEGSLIYSKLTGGK